MGVGVGWVNQNREMFRDQPFLILPCDATWQIVRDSNSLAAPKGLWHLAYGTSCWVTGFVDEGGDGQHLLKSMWRDWDGEATLLAESLLYESLIAQENRQGRCWPRWQHAHILNEAAWSHNSKKTKQKSTQSSGFQNFVQKDSNMNGNKCIVSGDWSKARPFVIEIM